MIKLERTKTYNKKFLRFMMSIQKNVQNEILTMKGIILAGRAGTRLYPFMMMI